MKALFIISICVLLLVVFGFVAIKARKHYRKLKKSLGDQHKENQLVFFRQESQLANGDIDWDYSALNSN